ncbi:hypothetical protein [Promicromonospora sukumoe]|uniref:hypothetical protein n=1 Tax=Promicromonospora sukumoe TaxID=88382 RepID=UPI00365790F4
MLLRPLGHAKGTLDELRDLVADDPAFDLLALARDAHHADGTKLWSAADDERLRTAVEAGEPNLTTLAAELGVPEGQIVSRMTRVQIVSSTLAAVERLGADPRGRRSFMPCWCTGLGSAVDTSACVGPGWVADEVGEVFGHDLAHRADVELLMCRGTRCVTDVLGNVFDQGPPLDEGAVSLPIDHIYTCVYRQQSVCLAHAHSRNRSTADPTRCGDLVDRLRRRVRAADGLRPGHPTRGGTELAAT